MKLILFFPTLLFDVFAQEQPLTYGVDISFPQHYYNASSNFAWLPHNVDPENNPTPPDLKNIAIQPLGDKETWYQKHIQGCVDFYGEKGTRCIENERERIDMNLRQPQSMRNYTKYGFTKIRAPDKVFEMLKAFWEANRGEEYLEDWPVGNTYTNHWKTPTYMLSVENRKLKRGGKVLKQSIWDAARDTISEWTGQQLAECSLYGIRIYKEGAVLAPHVDRLPLVASAIINVDQDTDEPWPLEVIGHDGLAHNVTMVPGDLVLYESHSVIHGRQFPLKGRFMANVFIHFEPIGEMGIEIDYATKDLPPYVIPGSLEESNWREQNPDGHILMNKQKFEAGSTDAHTAAQEANLEDLRVLIETDESIVNARDINGWTPLHEGIRKGDFDVVKFLIEKGSDINARTGNGGDGGSALYWAKEFLGVGHAIVQLLEQHNAAHQEPEARDEL
mmetsp:Transcript_6355/g.9783  ORF Transcript_6355/g.9783 Transcript_6355/m.9783 type:complete len:446 (-) Transcript_6355:1110-2447(-)